MRSQVSLALHLEILKTGLIGFSLIHRHTLQKIDQFKVLDDIYIIFTETAHIPCVSTGGLRPDYTHIFELLVGEAHFFAGRPPIQKGQVYHHTNQTVECQGGSIVRITSTRKAGRPEMSKAAEQEFIKVRDKIKTCFGV